MAKSLHPSVQAFQFVFEPKELKKVLEKNPDKVVFTVSIVEEVTKNGDKVGALKINAKGAWKRKKSATLGMESAAIETASEDDGGVPGCPVPPCTTDGVE
jgi:hypothetical protein